MSQPIIPVGNLALNTSSVPKFKNTGKILEKPGFEISPEIPSFYNKIHFIINKPPTDPALYLKNISTGTKNRKQEKNNGVILKGVLKRLQDINESDPKKTNEKSTNTYSTLSPLDKEFHSYLSNPNHSFPLSFMEIESKDLSPISTPRAL